MKAYQRLLTARPTTPTLAPVLLADLAEFITRHRACGRLTGDDQQRLP